MSFNIGYPAFDKQDGFTLQVEGVFCIKQMFGFGLFKVNRYDPLFATPFG